MRNKNLRGPEGILDIYYTLNVSIAGDIYQPELRAGHIYTRKKTLPPPPNPLDIFLLGLCAPTRLIGADLSAEKKKKCITKPRLSSVTNHAHGRKGPC